MHIEQPPLVAAHCAHCQSSRCTHSVHVDDTSEMVFTSSKLSVRWSLPVKVMQAVQQCDPTATGDRRLPDYINTTTRPYQQMWTELRTGRCSPVHRVWWNQRWLCLLNLNKIDYLFNIYLSYNQNCCCVAICLIKEKLGSMRDLLDKCLNN